MCTGKPSKLQYRMFQGARKFRITRGSQSVLPAEAELEEVCHRLAERVAPLHRRLAPDCFNNMCLFEEAAIDCRIGREPGRPYSGITTVVDFCAHSHRDTTNMVGGCTAIVTLTKPENRNCREPDDEQFHTLPMYLPDCSEAEMAEATASGGLMVLDRFSKKVIIGQKETSCKRRPAKRKLGLSPSPDQGRSPAKQKCPTEPYMSTYGDPHLDSPSFRLEQQQLPSGLADGQPWLPSMAGEGGRGSAPSGDSHEDSGVGENAAAQRMANIQIYESDCGEAFR